MQCTSVFVNRNSPISRAQARRVGQELLNPVVEAVEVLNSLSAISNGDHPQDPTVSSHHTK